MLWVKLKPLIHSWYNFNRIILLPNTSVTKSVSLQPLGFWPISPIRPQETSVSQLQSKLRKSQAELAEAEERAELAESSLSRAAGRNRTANRALTRQVNLACRSWSLQSLQVLAIVCAITFYFWITILSALRCWFTRVAVKYFRVANIYG